MIVGSIDFVPNCWFPIQSNIQLTYVCLSERRVYYREFESLNALNYQARIFALANGEMNYEPVEVYDSVSYLNTTEDTHVRLWFVHLRRV